MADNKDDDIFADPRKNQGDRRKTLEGRSKDRRQAGAQLDGDWWNRRQAGIAKHILYKKEDGAGEDHGQKG